jgi:hypothetical protein
MKTIVYLGGFWSTNIGNAFYNLGILYALESAFANANILFLGDHPGWFWKNRKKYRNSEVLIDDIECDYMIISGPLFCSRVRQMWTKSLQRIRAKGTKIVLMSAGSLEYTKEEYNQCKIFLKEIKPYLIMTRDNDTYIIMTRDNDTYRAYGEFAEYSYDGICFAFFCSDYLSDSPKIESEDIIFCFDKGHDYDVIEKCGSDIINLLNQGNWFSKIKPSILKRSYKASKISQYNKYRIVRPYHESNPPLFRKKFKSNLLGYKEFNRPNCYIADIPEGYLYLYRNAKMTIAERVHSCVPAIAFGNYAWLISKTKRSRLFSRIGLDQITARPVRGDMDKLVEEKKKIIQFIKQVF